MGKFVKSLKTQFESRVINQNNVGFFCIFSSYCSWIQFVYGQKYR